MKSYDYNMKTIIRYHLTYSPSFFLAVFLGRSHVTQLINLPCRMVCAWGGDHVDAYVHAMEPAFRQDSTSTLLKSLMQNETWLSAYSLGKNMTVHFGKLHNTR